MKSIVKFGLAVVLATSSAFAFANNTHKVAYGETFYGIAVKHGLSWTEPEKLKAGTVLNVGSKLR